MKIAWFTPFHRKSAIGCVSKLVCEELVKTENVEIWTANKTNTIETSVPIHFFEADKINLNNLSQYDYLLYNMGNYAGNHKDIWSVMQRYPGVLLLHDQIMQNFFFQITMVPEFGGNSITGEKDYSKLMRTHYGARGESASLADHEPYFSKKAVRLWDSIAATSFPLFEPLLKSATAVFTHASFFENIIRHYFYGPTGYAYLPMVSRTLEIKTVTHLEFLNKDKSLVVSNGMVHPVKRIDRVAEMFLANPDIASEVQYVVIGDYGGEYGDYLASLAVGPLKGCLYLMGYQPDNVMEELLNKADFFVNLRYPNSEVCSKSLIEQMAFAKPTIALNSGIFAEIPDNCIVKVNIENEMQELSDAFRFLINEKSSRLEIGAKASEFVAQNCSPLAYVNRLKDFLQKIPPTIALDKIVNETIRLNKQALIDLGFSPENWSSIVDTAARQLNHVFQINPNLYDEKQVLGVWLGFPYRVGLKREGITKFLLYLLTAMLERYPINCELWTYSINEEEVRESFRYILVDREINGRVKVVTERNYQKALNVPEHTPSQIWEVNENLDNLAEVAREHSKATSFITAIVYLDNLIATNKRLFVPVHDLSIHTNYDDFVRKDPLYKARYIDIHTRAERLARAGAFMFSNSEFVRQEHLLKYISSINEVDTATVYLPVNIPKGVLDHVLPQKTIRARFGLKKPYIFYPTQIRPYKNVKVLIEALSIIKNRGSEIELVLTGNPSDVPEVEMAIQQLNLKEAIRNLSDITDEELYSLYRYAELSAVPTLFEGGFPWQACEALFMETPLVLSDIPVVRERIEFLGMKLEECGIKLFNPTHPKELADAIEAVLLDKASAIVSQKAFRDKLLSYSWYDAAERYYNMFFAERDKVNFTGSPPW